MRIFWERRDHAHARLDPRVGRIDDSQRRLAAGDIGQRGAHIFALMADTEYGDGLPNVVLEAMASGRPVILSPLPAAEEAITNGVEGIILNSATDEEGMVNALQRLAGDRAKLPVMGQAARRRVESKFDQDIHARRLKGLFEQIAVPQPAMLLAA